MDQAEIQVVSAVIKKALNDRRDNPDEVAQEAIAALDQYRMENAEKHQLHMVSELAGLAQSQGG